MAPPTRGVVYIATGEQYIKEAHRSVQSLKDACGDIHTTLFTDDKVGSEYFDDIRQLEDPDHDFGDSILKPSMTPYDKTLFLDSDTHICGDITDVFELLDRFDIAAAHNPGSRVPEAVSGYKPQDLPDAFPLYNTGVIAYRDTEAVNEFFADWEDTYFRSKTGSGLNQPAFRKTLFQSDLEIATLPSEYNLRIRYKGSTGFMTDTVKIVHGRHPAELSTVAKHMNAKTGMRVFTMKKWPIEVTSKSPGLRYYILALIKEDTKTGSFRRRFVTSIRNRGVADTLSRVAGYLRKTQT